MLVYICTARIAWVTVRNRCRGWLTIMGVSVVLGQGVMTGKVQCASTDLLNSTQNCLKANAVQIHLVEGSSKFHTPPPGNAQINHIT